MNAMPAWQCGSHSFGKRGLVFTLLERECVSKEVKDWLSLTVFNLGHSHSLLISAAIYRFRCPQAFGRTWQNWAFAKSLLKSSDGYNVLVALWMLCSELPEGKSWVDEWKNLPGCHQLLPSTDYPVLLLLEKWKLFIPLCDSSVIHWGPAIWEFFFFLSGNVVWLLWRISYWSAFVMWSASGNGVSTDDELVLGNG